MSQRLIAVSQIDDETTLGLAGTANSLSYRVGEIERHFHSYERWLGAGTVPSGENHIAATLASGTPVNGLVIDAGDNTWGSWTQILGATDTPISAGAAKYDLHRILITAAERTAVTFIQLAFGASGTAAFAAGAYTEVIYAPTTATAEEIPIEVQMRRVASGTKAWARTRIPSQSTGTVEVWLGLHEYEG